MAAQLTTNRVLIVEDDAGIRSVMARHFRRKGYEVEQAAAAEEVVNRFANQQKRFDLVLTDVHLPGESGVEMARRIHAVEPQQQIVFMTGDADATLAQAALQDGAAGYLMKPFELFELDAVVDRAVQRPITRAPHVTKPARVVLSPRRRRRSNVAARVRVAFATAAMLGVAWLAGAGVGPGPVTPETIAQQEADDRPIVVPVVIQQPSYRK